MAENSKSSPFTPYVNTLNENDPIRKIVPMGGMDIGANSASMPNGLESRPDGIAHVGSGVKK